jgi:hypothetical protein
MTECSHLGLIRNVHPRTRGCEECLKMGDVWVHLGCASPAATSAAAIHRRTSTPRSTFIRPSTQSCDRSNPAKIGAGVMWAK